MKDKERILIRSCLCNGFEFRNRMNTVKVGETVIDMKRFEELLYEVEEALNRQEKKKPLNVEDKYWGCPRCYGLLMVRWITYPTNPVPLESGRNYCEDCGQAIDWSEDK